jgi:large subunit ribosomal protein L2
MSLKSFKPTTPSNRYKVLPAFDEITKSKPEKSLLEPIRKSGGRNNNGRITTRHIGGGHKKHYRLVDFRRTRTEAATVLAIEYDPNRTCRIALVQYPDGAKSYILAPVGLTVGMTVQAGENVAPKVGNAMPLKNVPLGTAIHNIEVRPGTGG